MKKEQIGTGAWGFREIPLEDRLRATAAMGLERLEFSIACAPKDEVTLDADEKVLNHVKQSFARHHIVLDCAMVGNDFTLPDADACRRQLDQMKRKIDLACRLGVKQLRIFAGFSHAREVTGERWARMITCLNEAAEYAEPRHLQLAVETHGVTDKLGNNVVIHHPTVSIDPEMLRRLLDETSTNITVNWDPANIQAALGIDPTVVLPIIGSRLSYVHLKDYRVVDAATRAITPVGCGEGVLFWEPILAALVDFSGPVIIEYEPVADVADGCRRSLKFLKKQRYGIDNKS